MILENSREQLWALLNVAIACMLSGAIGYEREVHRKPAGFRTQMIVGGASALLVILADAAVSRYEILHKDALNVDPIRIIQAIVIGVSFIGAGTIMKQKEDIVYLTTAATILFSAGIGIGIGLRQYILCVGVTILALLINHTFRRLEP